MSLSEIEQRTGVPVAYIIEHLGVPSDVPLHVAVGKLGKQFGFDIGDVRRAIQEYRAVK